MSAKDESGIITATQTQPLTGRVALVAGATRGAGRGIACALGEAGAAYCTGRSIPGKLVTQGRREPIAETAEMVTARGGKGIAVRCDQTKESDVKRLVARIQREQKGRLDILVNDVTYRMGQDLLAGFTRQRSEDARAGRVLAHHYQPPCCAPDGET